MKFTKKTMAYILIGAAALGGLIYLLMKGVPSASGSASTPNGSVPDPRGSWAQADDIAF